MSVHSTVLPTRDLLNSRLNGQHWDKHTVTTLVERIVRGEATDCQTGAFLAACYLRQLTHDETFALTDAMLHSGTVFKWPEDWLVVDKHSTGGVGDKISLVLAPALAALGLKVPMISGRGLGLTGGTLDKLESIPGYQVSLSEQQIHEVVDTVGCCIVGQTSSIVPADAILYAARDETGTVASIPLIVGSIISKKLAEGLKALVLEVTYGGMAFLKDKQMADEFVEMTTKVCSSMDMSLSHEYVQMNCPVGHMVGNALEVVEALDSLHGEGPAYTTELTALLGARLLVDTNKATTVEEGKRIILETLKNGSALAKFQQMLQHQGVSADVANKLCSARGEERFSDGLLRGAGRVTPLTSDHSGEVTEIVAKNIAMVVMWLGGGRVQKGAHINHAVGVQLKIVVGQNINAGDVWVMVHHDDDLTAEILTTLRDALRVH